MSSTPGGGMFSRDPDLPNLIVTSHPLLRHQVTLLRKRDTPKKIFKELVDEIAMLLAYEVTSDLGTETVRVETPLESTTGDIVLGERLTLVPGSSEAALRKRPTGESLTLRSAQKASASIGGRYRVTITRPVSGRTMALCLMK